MFKKPLILGALFLISIGLLGFSINFYKKIQYAEAADVKALILEQPLNCDGVNYRTTFVKLKFRNKVFIKKIGKEYCKYIGNKKLDVKISKNGKEMFVGRQDFIGQMIGSFILLLFGVFTGYKSLKR